MLEASKPLDSAKLRSLSGMVYSGRGITMGMTPDGTPFVAYTLSGRSASSKARRLVLAEQGERVVVSTKPTDEAALQKGNPALLLYPVIIADANKIAISNGVQTELAFLAPLPQALANPVDVSGIDITSYEPDSPNFTPRITGTLTRQEQSWVSVFHTVRKAADSDSPVREVHQYELKPGTARTLTTYAGGNETPLLPFTGEPMEMEVTFDAAWEFCRHLFSILRGAGSDDYRVSAAVLQRFEVGGGVNADVALLNASDGGSIPKTSLLHLPRA